jgi:hypothetical protein
MLGHFQEWEQVHRMQETTRIGKVLKIASYEKLCHCEGVLCPKQSPYKQEIASRRSQ